MNAHLGTWWRAVFALALLTACKPDYAKEKQSIWIVPGSSSTELSFGMATKRHGTQFIHVDTIRVNKCADSTYAGTMWKVARARSAEARPLHIRYGNIPEGFFGDIAPQPLQPGCYRLRTDRSGALTFIVKEDGNVEEKGT